MAQFIKAKNLEPVYFGKANWSVRLDEWLRERSPEYEAFHHANASHIAQSILEGEAALRMVVNIPPDALLGFLRVGRYQNAYERKVAIGLSPNNVNERRRRVDQLLFESEAGRYYFGALALGGCGVRFYGEYCMVLREVAPETRLMDRNSWDIEFEPLNRCDPKEVVRFLKGQWGSDATHIAKLKVLPQLMERVRLTTTGTVSEALLNDESFVEVHKKDSFVPKDLYEIREPTTGPSVEAQLRYRCDQGQHLSVEEAIWLHRRSYLNRELANNRIRPRIVETSGRSR